MKPQQVHWAAENSFVREEKTLAQISADLGVSQRSLVQWSKEGEWMKKRQERRRESPQAALDTLKSQRELKIKQIRDKKEATAAEIDALHKLSVLIEKMESRVEAIGPMLDTLERFAQFVGAHADDEARAVLLEWTEKFLDEERGKRR